MLEKISNKEFLDALHKELKISKETTKSIALDIVNNLIPLLEKVPEDQLKEYNRKKLGLEKNNSNTEEVKYKKEDFQEALLQKIRGNLNTSALDEKEEELPAPPYIKKVPITNVEKNAKKMRDEGKNIITEKKEQIYTTKEQETQVQSQEIKPDPYKEPVE
jgi:hydroxymethylpyrimidine pyrophosphatase-like HAD family hydrolase